MKNTNSNNNDSVNMFDGVAIGLDQSVEQEAHTLTEIYCMLTHDMNKATSTIDTYIDGGAVTLDKNKYNAMLKQLQNAQSMLATSIYATQHIMNRL